MPAVPVYEYAVVYNDRRSNQQKTITLVATDDQQAREEATYTIPCGLSDIVTVNKGNYLFDDEVLG